jgi:transcriptional regulator with XRE-family HTH domain
MYYLILLSTPCVPLRLLFPLLRFVSIALYAMPAAKTPRASRHHTAQSFGELLTQARKAAGYTQQELADALGISRRMVVYYEGQEAPPLAVFVASAVKVLGVSADELMGCQAAGITGAPANAKLARRLVALEAMPAATQRQAIELLDALIERAQLKQARKD